MDRLFLCLSNKAIPGGLLVLLFRRRMGGSSVVWGCGILQLRKVFWGPMGSEIYLKMVGRMCRFVCIVCKGGVLGNIVLSSCLHYVLQILSNKICVLPHHVVNLFLCYLVTKSEKLWEPICVVGWKFPNRISEQSLYHYRETRIVVWILVTLGPVQNLWFSLFGNIQVMNYATGD